MTDAERFSFFSDAPDFSGFTWPDGAPEDIPSDVKPPTNRVQVAKVGRFKHPTYGAFTVTRDTFDAFVRNFDAGYPTDRLPVDFDHDPDRGGPTRACGWISKLEPDGDHLFATVEWTWEGAYALREQTYRYVSPTWQMNSIDEAGEKRGPTLLAFALTNRPYFQMPAVSLSQTFSQADLELAVEDTDPEAEPSSDSRRRMTDFLTKIAAVFSLAEDATEDQILTAAHSALAARVPEGHIAITAARVTELEASAKVPPGHTVIASNVLEGVEQKAASADRYKEELAEIKFETAFTQAAGEGRATPAEKDYFRRVFDADQDLAVNMLRDRLPVVVTAARGDAGDDLNGDSPDGVDTDRHELDRKVRLYMRSHNLTEDQYIDALDQVVAQGGTV